MFPGKVGTPLSQGLSACLGYMVGVTGFPGFIQDLKIKLWRSMKDVLRILKAILLAKTDSVVTVCYSSEM
jgi:hypothetical protein